MSETPQDTVNIGASEDSPVVVGKQFVIKRQNKDFVLFVGLVDAAHRKGLQSLHTEQVVVQWDDSGEPLYALFHAIAYMKDGTQFHGHGDASKGNVGGGIKPHLIRMAETRAKARALRDALNVTMAAVEELDERDDSGGQSTKPQTPYKAPKSAVEGNGQPKATPSQRATIAELVLDVQYPGGLEGFSKKVLKGKKIADIPESSAAKIIANLRDRKAKMESQQPKTQPEEEFDEEDLEPTGQDPESVAGVSKGVPKS